MLKSKKGHDGDSGLGDGGKEGAIWHSITEPKYLLEKLKPENFYAVITASRIYGMNDWEGNPETKAKAIDIINKINNKTFKGVIAVIDCHD